MNRMTTYILVLLSQVNLIFVPELSAIQHDLNQDHEIHFHGVTQDDSQDNRQDSSEDHNDHHCVPHSCSCRLPSFLVGLTEYNPNLSLISDNYTNHLSNGYHSRFLRPPIA